MESDERILRKLEDLQVGFTDLREEVRVGFAELPSVYVSQESIDQSNRQSSSAKRFAIASIITSLGVLGTFIGIFIALI